ncbi:VWA-like domain-containing protein [Paraburkholderia sp. BL10I2N1]|uniref:vWA domain-containing protein n=1 Tax=Paraburkholderia sp. BL10I2N1 TaxID=1938796 RepID=UPI001060F332|nr:VWA-like domain-containing protein [Paraburkholderia sp. BL10I2N1]TDN59037.1 putative metal-dependent peptidase [Paraburkholderia sp. BL10I2N1]
MDPRISKQRTALVLDQPFFGALALRLKVIEDPSCTTFWTDSVSIGYNPTYLASLNDLETRGVLAHEVLHVANGHCWRQGDRDSDLWNDACDHAINPIIVDAGMLLPKGVLMDARFRGMSAEEIYGILAQEKRQKQKQQGEGQKDGGKPGGQSGQQAGDPPGGSSPPQSANGANTPSEGSDPAASADTAPSCGEVRQYAADDRAKQEAEWKVAVHQAAKAAQMRGGMPGALQGMIAQAVEPAVDWRAILHRFAQESSPTDYSFAMPNRRYLHMRLYLPSLHEPAVGDGVFVRDASGSVWDETQAQFAAEILAVNDAVRPRRLIVMDCDTRVTQVQTFERGEAVELLPVLGGGGTSFVDPFRRLAHEGIHPAFLVYLTDMDGAFPGEEPAYPVLWASTTPLKRARQAPFGEMVEVIC